MTGPSRFFGYGSLVNAQTHAYGGLKPAVVEGWRRQWVQSNATPIAFLSVVPDPASRIAGVLADVGDIGWAGLDEREHAYDRVTLPAPHGGVQMYRASPRHVGAADLGHPILLSYLDVVVQGFNRLFGPEGAADFFRSTSGWETPVMDDRAVPAYPRAQRLSADETALVDRYLADFDVRIIPPAG